MSRNAQTIKKRILEKDPVYDNVMITKFINHIMVDGKKTVAQKQVYRAFEIIQKKNKDPLNVFEDALKNVAPQMEVRSRRIGGAAYQVPAPVRNPRKTSLAIRWIIEQARKRPSKEYHTFADKLSAELIDASQNEGGAIKKKETAHKMAESNKAFAHFKW